MKHWRLLFVFSIASLVLAFQEEGRYHLEINITLLFIQIRLRNDFYFLCLGDHLYETNYDAYFDKYSPYKHILTERQDIESVSTAYDFLF